MSSIDPKASQELEAQLAGVFEQDGLTMASPEGVRRRVKRIKKKNEDVVVRAGEGLRSRPVAIARAPHPRSRYVLSLRHLLMNRIEQVSDRVRIQDALVHPESLETFSREHSVYKTLAYDLTVTSVDPRVFTEQFTPEATVSIWRLKPQLSPVVILNEAKRSEESLREKRLLNIQLRLTRFQSEARSSLRHAYEDAISLFQRVQHVEERVSDEVVDTIQTIEVRRLSPVRAVAGFMALVFTMTLPANAIALYRNASDTQQMVESVGQEALHEVVAAKDAPSLPSSIEALRSASSRFRDADAMLTESHGLAFALASVLPEKYRSARALFEVGDKMSEAGRLLALGFEKTFRDSSRGIDERLLTLGAYARGTLPLLRDASRAVASVSPSSLPEDKRAMFETLQARLESSTQAVQEFAGLADFGAELVGKSRARTYLLIFQNESELRPSGGFMGSVAEVTLDHGALKRLRVPTGGTYDIKGQLTAHVISPAPLHLINPHWQFQDANWSPDFPTTAKKIRWFWSKAGQPTVDGIVAINASFVERVLDITGPIEMPEYGKTVDRSNFRLETQKAVEVEYDREANTPKKFVGDLASLMIERMKTFTSDEWLRVVAMMTESLQTKDIQVSLMREEEEALVERYGWSGQLKPVNGDALALVEANIAGQKTDTVITEKASLIVAIQPDGSIIDQVALTRTHHGKKGEQFSGVRNVSYLRAYVPKGSELLDASGFETPSSTLFKKPDEDYVPDVDIAAIESSLRLGPGDVEVGEEKDRTIFGGWMQLDPGETQTITYRYRLPFTISDVYAHLDAGPGEQPEGRGAYLLLLTSQSGKASREISVSVQAPADWRMAWKRDAQSGTETSLSYQGLWDRDRVMAAMYEK